MIKQFNDLLALITLIVIIPGMWVADGLGLLEINGAVIGATIMGWTLVLQYYFRRKPPK